MISQSSFAPACGARASAPPAEVPSPATPEDDREDDPEDDGVAFEPAGSSAAPGFAAGTEWLPLAKGSAVGRLNCTKVMRSGARRARLLRRAAMVAGGQGEGCDLA